MPLLWESVFNSDQAIIGHLARVGSAVMRGLPDMHGARAYPLSEYGIAGGIAVGSVLAGMALAFALAIRAADPLRVARQDRRAR